MNGKRQMGNGNSARQLCMVNRESRSSLVIEFTTVAGTKKARFLTIKDVFHLPKQANTYAYYSQLAARSSLLVAYYHLAPLMLFAV